MVIARGLNQQGAVKDVYKDDYDSVMPEKSF
jgi:hypothetical protein